MRDPHGPFVAAGIRLGTPAGTSRGFGEAEFVQIGNWIAEILKNKDDATIQKIAGEVKTLAKKFPLYQ